MINFIIFLFVAFGLFMIGAIVMSAIETFTTPAYRKKLEDYANKNHFSIKNKKHPYVILYKPNEIGIEIASREGMLNSDIKIKSYKDVFITNMESLITNYFIADDRANAFHIIQFIDVKDGMIGEKTDGFSGSHIKIPYEDVIRVEISFQGKIIYKKDNAVGRALVGGALFGSAGAIVGSTSSTTTATKEETATLRILINNIQNPSIVISGINVENAENVKAIIEVVLNRIEKGIKKTNNDIISDVSNQISEREELESNDLLARLDKLGQLKEKGILTEEEFNIQKAKILSE